MIVVTGKRRSIINPAYILAPIGIVMIMVALVWFARTAQFLDDAIQVNGTVIDIVEQGKGVTPLIMFEDSDNTQYRFRPRSSQSPSPYQIGDVVQVYYDFDRPAHSKLDSFVSLWLGPTLIGSAGVVNLLLAIILGLVYKRKHKLSQPTI